MGNKGLAVIQQRFDKNTKKTWWTEIDPWLVNDLYLNDGFKAYFDEHAKECTDGLYPTVTTWQIMWALKMKPIPWQQWETVFDRKHGSIRKNCKSYNGGDYNKIFFERS